MSSRLSRRPASSTSGLTLRRTAKAQPAGWSRPSMMLAHSRRRSVAWPHEAGPYGTSSAFLDTKPLSELHGCLPAIHGPASDHCRSSRQAEHPAHSQAAPVIQAFFCCLGLDAAESHLCRGATIGHRGSFQRTVCSFVHNVARLCRTAMNIAVSAANRSTLPRSYRAAPYSNVVPIRIPERSDPLDDSVNSSDWIHAWRFSR